MKHVIRATAGLIVAFALANTGCGDINADLQPADIDHAHDSPDASMDATDVFEGRYHEIYLDEGSRTLYALGRSDEALRLYSAMVPATPWEQLVWTRNALPHALAHDANVRVTSLVRHEGALFLATGDHGAWTREASSGRWQPFEIDGAINEGQVTRFAVHEGRLFAHIVYRSSGEHSAAGERRVQIWAESQEGWQLQHEALNMLIDYVPQRTRTLRSTMYGTVEIQREMDDMWERVAEINQGASARLTLWEGEMSAITRGGVWRSHTNAEHWEKLPGEGAWRFAIARDGLVLSQLDQRIEIMAPDATRHALPPLPTTSVLPAELAALGDEVFATVYDDHIYRLAGDRQSWIPMTPAIR
ncbi:hypothetical protein FRC98_08555 [Lujinxingia vulgaris]|uniref:Uncharacterized protein n=1 Tax=Lujinxingia vulgaris TaxID=2600176 RepID=A0A5C6XFT0_9DELT|nr:hypothetical protein [Lujinxingia vulgaris]TXD37727.1 hypothetical protein FRC98_08555 [Lujinxingia vulgaris]